MDFTLDLAKVFLKSFLIKVDISLVVLLVLL